MARASRELGPGEKVSLHGLAESLGVSRSPVHHALTRLVSEGLLTVKSRRGYHVTPLTEAAVAEGYDVRLALELQAAEARRRPGPARRVAPPLPRAGRRDGGRRFPRRVGHGQRGLPRAPGRPGHEQAPLPLLPRALSINLMMQVIRGGRLEGIPYLPREHGAIVAAYEAGDLDAARAAIRAHIATGRRIALEAIDGAGGVL